MTSEASIHRHIRAATASVARSVAQLQRDSRNGKVTPPDFGKQINNLMIQIRKTRDLAIFLELESGFSGRQVAANYGLTEGRVSQIKSAHLA